MSHQTHAREAECAAHKNNINAKTVKLSFFHKQNKGFTYLTVGLSRVKAFTTMFNTCLISFSGEKTETQPILLN